MQKGAKLTKKVKSICWITLAALIILSLLCTPTYALSDAYLVSVMGQEYHEYVQYTDGSTGMGSLVSYDLSYTETNATVTEHIIAREDSDGNGTIKYFYIPIYTTNAKSVSWEIIHGTQSSYDIIGYTVTAVDSIYQGVATPCVYNQSEYYLMQSITDYRRWYGEKLSVVCATDLVDVIRITLDAETTGDFFLALTDIINVTATPEQLYSDISNISTSINNVITEIQTNTTTTDGALQQLTNTVIQYGEDGLYHLEAITQQTDGQKLVYQTLQQHFNTALQAIYAQNQIIHNNVISNAPSEQQINHVISKDQIAPDVNVAVIGAGTSNSGIGIIMSQSRIIAMMVCVMGIAILSYLLFGRKT